MRAKVAPITPKPQNPKTPLIMNLKEYLILIESKLVLRNDCNERRQSSARHGGYRRSLLSNY